ncbi:MAG: DUF3015 family protein [Bdellovibrionaceae bacterium]|nr:DUF3015 family protein [Pseudobdellovibrionaceae bacterium]
MKYIIFTLISVLAASAHAKKIGQAGCGLGNQLIGAEPGVMQIVAATSNGICTNQTSGITSGTSNCLDSAIDVALVDFVEENQVALKNDMSRGQGETVSTMSNMLSCANEKVAGEALKQSFEQITSQQTPEAMAQSIRQTLSQTPLAGCAG